MSNIEESKILVDDVILKLEKELQSSIKNAEFLKKILDGSHEGIVVTDTDGYIIMISKTYCEFLGYLSEADVIGKHVTDIIENTRMHIVGETGIPEMIDMQRINDGYMIASRFPIFEDEKIIAVVGKMVFRNLDEFEGVHTRIVSMEKELHVYKNEINRMNRAKYSFTSIIGNSFAIEQSKVMAKKSSATNSSVLLLGESGTGKELFAHAIHKMSSRANEPFIKVNCAAIPAELMESELFGYEQGSFTGAKKGGKMGKFQVADGGTIFLDEIGDMPMSMQVKLLRVLQEMEIEKIGSNKPIKIDVRVIAATNKDLLVEVENKTFRGDLYYRLNVISIVIPSLKDRIEDVEPLVKHFLSKYSKRFSKNVSKIDRRTLSCLMDYDWPGNIRELENIIERAINIIDNEDIILPEHIPLNIAGSHRAKEITALKILVEDTEKQAIIDCINFTNGNKSKAAKMLDISRTSLYEKIEKYNLSI